MTLEARHGDTRVRSGSPARQLSIPLPWFFRRLHCIGRLIKSSAMGADFDLQPPVPSPPLRSPWKSGGDTGRSSPLPACHCSWAFWGLLLTTAVIIAKAGCVSRLSPRALGEHARSASCSQPLPLPGGTAGGRGRDVGAGWGGGGEQEGPGPGDRSQGGHVASTCTCEIGFLREPKPAKHRLGTDPEAKARPCQAMLSSLGPFPRPRVPGPSGKTSPLGVTGLGVQHGGVSGCGFESHPKNTNWATSLPSSQAVPTWASLPVSRLGRTSPQL